MTLILLQNRIPVKPSSLGKLKRHRGVFHELSMRKNSLKRRRQNLQKQPGSGFWQGSRVFPNMSSLSRTRVKLYKDSNTMLVKFLQEANEREDVIKRDVERWHRAYDDINREHLVSKYKDLCSTCKRHRDETEAGDTIILCKGFPTVE